LKKAAVLTGIFLISIFGFTACGGSANSDPGDEEELPVSNVQKRVFVLNQFSGKLQIVDAATDTLTAFVVPHEFLSTFSRAEFILRNGSNSLVLDSGTGILYVIDSALEGVSTSFPLDGPAEGVVVTSSGATAYVAIPGLGRVQVADIAGKALKDPINNLAGVRRLAVSKDGSKLLAFSNDVNTIYVINTADRTVTSVGGFDRPYTAVFSADDTKAFILSCGAECGGTQARVTVLNLANNTLGASVNVGGATVGLLDGSNLLVAGSPTVSTSSTNGGTINVVNVSNLAALTASAAFPISDGLHHTIVPVGGGKYYIGALRCTIINSGGVNKGCLSIFNGTAGSVGAARGDVTSIATIKNRNVVYVTQGGELDIYDLSTDSLQARQIDISGKAIDAKEID